jgi:hypothetical protein
MASPRSTLWAPKGEGIELSPILSAGADVLRQAHGYLDKFSKDLKPEFPQNKHNFAFM